MMELFVAKASNKLDIYSREVLMYPLCFISHHNERLDFVMEGPKIRVNFHWEKRLFT